MHQCFDGQLFRACPSLTSLCGATLMQFNGISQARIAACLKSPKLVNFVSLQQLKSKSWSYLKQYISYLATVTLPVCGVCGLLASSESTSPKSLEVSNYNVLLPMLIIKHLWRTYFRYRNDCGEHCLESVANLLSYCLLWRNLRKLGWGRAGPLGSCI